MIFVLKILKSFITNHIKQKNYENMAYTYVHRIDAYFL